MTKHTLQMLTAQPKKETRYKYNVFSCVVSICSVFLYLFVLWAFAASAVKMMKMFSWFAAAFSICMFSEVAVCWALSATVDRTEEFCCHWRRMHNTFLIYDIKTMLPYTGRYVIFTSQCIQSALHGLYMRKYAFITWRCSDTWFDCLVRTQVRFQPSLSLCRSHLTL